MVKFEEDSNGECALKELRSAKKFLDKGDYRTAVLSLSRSLKAIYEEYIWTVDSEYAYSNGEKFFDLTLMDLYNRMKSYNVLEDIADIDVDYFYKDKKELNLSEHEEALLMYKYVYAVFKHLRKILFTLAIDDKDSGIDLE